MAFKITEFLTSRKVRFAKDSESIELSFIGYGTDDDGIARDAFNALIPLTFTGITGPLARLDITCDTLGGLFWRAAAVYSADPAPTTVGLVVPGDDTPLDASFSVDFSGVSEHITQSISTKFAIGRTGYPDPPANTQRAIGVTADGQVTGCEKISPNIEWSREVTFPYVTPGMIKLWANLVGTTNASAFYTWEPKSNVFLGGQTTGKDNQRRVVTFKFKANPNLEGVNICDGLLVPVKYGSEFIWVSYVNVKDANQLTQQPQAAYVEQICREEDWSILGIGS